MPETTQSNEREQVAEVFGLTSGELEDTPWTPTYITETYQEERLAHFTYWYQGIPEYETPALDCSCHEYRTVVRDCMFGLPPAFVTDTEGMWERRNHYRSSGECKCPYDDPSPEGSICPLCEETGDHGYIYIGDGWAEVVYRRPLA